VFHISIWGLGALLGGLSSQTPRGDGTGWCPGRLLDWMPLFQFLVLSSGV